MPAKDGKADGTRLVIVESPAKAKTIAGYLGRGYIVESSIGHIRDLPEKAEDIPEKYKGEPWARLGVNVEHDFEPLYIVNPDKKAQVTKLKQLLKDADELYLATDEDREGEAIAWHLR
ncbi:MAG: toprim domain-containing protein, partial [Actinomycetes bacterium]